MWKTSSSRDLQVQNLSPYQEAYNLSLYSYYAKTTNSRNITLKDAWTKESSSIQLTVEQP